MKLTKDDVRHIAHLARLKLTEEEIAMHAEQLTTILDYVDMLKELNTEGVQETSQVTGLLNQLRKDEVDTSLCTPSELLECSPHHVVADQISIKRML